MKPYPLLLLACLMVAGCNTAPQTCECKFAVNGVFIQGFEVLAVTKFGDPHITQSCRPCAEAKTLEARHLCFGELP